MRTGERGIVASVPFVYRFYPMVGSPRRLARAPGTIRLVHGSYLQDWLSTADDDNWRVDAEWSGRSRAFADIGSHWCDLVEFVTGDRLVAVCAELVTALPERIARGRTSTPSRPATAIPVGLDRSPPRTWRWCCSGWPPGSRVRSS